MGKTVTNAVTTQRKRGQRKTNIEIPQAVLDRFTTDGLDLTTPRAEISEPNTLTLTDLFKRYYEARTAAGAAERTLLDYVKHMRWLREWMATKYSGLDNFVPSRDVIREWITHMLTVQNLKPSTINIRLRTIKAMFNWARTEGIIAENPFDNIDLLRVPEEDFAILTQQQERKLFKQCDLNTAIGLRDALLIAFLLDTGVRIGEAVSILRSDVDVANCEVLVRGESAKTRKARKVYFTIRTQRLLLAYLGWRDQAAEAPYLFINEYGTQLNKDWASKRIHYLGDAAGIKGVRVSPHTLRHTFATRYIQATGDPFSLRRLLGHTTMEMVNRYVNQNMDEVKAQYRKFGASASLTYGQGR
jgi:integrase/recombinase XerD